MLCPKCGKKNIITGAAHCEFCGANLAQRKLSQEKHTISGSQKILILIGTIIGIFAVGCICTFLYFTITANSTISDFAECLESGNLNSMSLYSESSVLTDKERSMIEDLFAESISEPEASSEDIYKAVCTYTEYDADIIFTFSTTATATVTIWGPNMVTVMNSALEKCEDEYISETEFYQIVMDEIDSCNDYITLSTEIPMFYNNGKWSVDYSDERIWNAITCNLLDTCKDICDQTSISISIEDILDEYTVEEES